MTTPAQPAGAPQEPIPPAEPLEPTSTQPGETPESQPAQPAYVTKEELDQRDAELLRRLKQSDRDRAKQIDARLTEITGMLKQSGVQVNEAQAAAIRNQITDQIDGAGEPQPAGASAALPPEVQLQVDFVYQQIDAAFQEAGTPVTPNDPEWSTVKAALDDPRGSLAKTIVAAHNAAATKKARVTSLQGSAPARVGGGGTPPTGQVPATSVSQAWEQAYKK